MFESFKTHHLYRYGAFTRSNDANQEAIDKISLKPTLTRLSIKKKKVAKIAAIMKTIIVVVIVSRLVGQVILSASDLTC